MTRSFVEEALKLFNAWAEDPETKTIHPALRESVWRCGLRKDPARTVKLLKDEWLTTGSADVKHSCLRVLASVRDMELLKPIISFNYGAQPSSGVVPSADMHLLGGGLAFNTTARLLQWYHVKNNWVEVVRKLGDDFYVDIFVRYILEGFNDESAIDEIDAFFADKDTKGFDRTLAIAKDKIRGRAAYKKRDAASLKEWLQSNGYL
jgi:hypothetical protein